MSEDLMDVYLLANLLDSHPELTCWLNLLVLKNDLSYHMQFAV